MEKNKEILLSNEEAVFVLKEINVILLSLHKMGSYYADKDMNQYQYEIETNRFIDDWEVTNRLAAIRATLTEKFDLTLGIDDMDDIERALNGVKIWRQPGDMPD